MLGMVFVLLQCQENYQPYTPWMSAAKREIKELKKGASYMLWLWAPMHVWGDCLVLEAYMVSRTVISRETSHISKVN